MTSVDNAILLENSLLRVVILPALGGKIASIKIKRLNLEILQQPLQPYGPRSQEQLFEDSDASGSDDCLPTVSACTMDWNGRTHHISDHGDIWRRPCVFTTSENQVNLQTDLLSLPLSLERTITLRENALQFRYRVTNTSAVPVPYLWSAHPLFVVDAGDRIVLPNEIHHLKLASSIGKRLANSGDLIPWPITFTSKPYRNSIDLSVALGPETETGDKLFANFQDQSKDGSAWCGLYRRAQKFGVSFAFLRHQLPYLGLWLCYGGWPPDRSARQQCVALEPCTSPTDSLEEAIHAGNCPILEPGCSAEWSLEWFFHGTRQPVSFQEFEISTKKCVPTLI